MQVATQNRVLAALLLLTSIGLAGALTGRAPVVVFDNLHWTCAYAAGAWLAWCGRLRAVDPRERRTRGWFALGLGMLTVGQLIWDVQVWLNWLPFPGPSDAFFLMLGPALAIGLWQLATDLLTPVQRRDARLDVAAFVVAVVAAALALFLPNRGSYSLFQILVMAAYPFGLIAPMSIGWILALTTRSRLEWRTWLLPVAAAAFATDWVIWNLRFLEDRLIDGGWLNASFSIVAIAIGAGSHGYRLAPREDPAWDRLCEGVLRLQPIVLVLVAAAGIVLTATLPGMSGAAITSAAVGGAIVVVLAMTRHALLLRERGRLIEVERLLRQREAELEARVETRTRELALATQEAQAANRAKSDFLAHMSHEIRTPLNGVLGLTELALRVAQSDDQRRFLETAHRSGQALLRMINDVLDISRIEAGKLELKERPFDAPEVLAEAVRSLSPLIQPEVLVVYDWFGDTPDLVGDDSALRQIVLNLLGNAIKFTEAGRIAVTGRIEPARAGTARLTVTVADPGPGVPPDRRADIFEPFVQADESLARRHGGAGLGLAIASRIAGAMGGAMTLDCPPEGGSSFTFEVLLPMAPSGVDLPAEPRPGCAWLIYSRSPGGRWLSARLERMGWQSRLFYGIETALASADDTTILRPDAVIIAQQVLQPGTDLAALRAALPNAAMHLMVSPGWHDVAIEGQARALGIGTRTAPLSPRMVRALAQQDARAVPAAAIDHIAVGPEVLLVEDNLVNQLVGQECLKALGLRVRLAGDGEAAVRACLEDTPDLVLMDLQMPHMDGLEATRELRRLQHQGNWRGAPIIALTAHADQEERQRCADAGMDGFLTKPLSLDTLRRLLATWLPMDTV